MGFSEEALLAYCEMLEDGGFLPDNFIVPNALKLVELCGRLSLAREFMDDAKKVFDGMLEKNVVAWNSMIMGYVQNGLKQRYFAICDWKASNQTECVLSASANLNVLQEGRHGHALAVLSGLELDDILGSSIMNFYSKVGMIEDVELIFSRMVFKDAVAWNLLMSSYVTFGKNLELGKEGHCYCIRNNLESDLVVSSSIIDMYGKCGRINVATRVFHSTSRRDLVLWNTMFARYAELGLTGEALKLFYQMQLESITPNVISWNSIILGFFRNGQVINAQEMFFQMNSFGIQPNLITWTTLISGLAQNGFGYEAILVFQQMQEAEIKPNTISIASALSACTRTPLLHYGKAIHSYVMRHDMYFSILITTSLLDMYAKCGKMDNAKWIFDICSSKELPIYNSMISAYASHGYARKALAIFKELVKEGIEPDNITFTSVLSACSHSGLLQEGLEFFNYMISKPQVKPSMEHYGCLVNLLSCCGKLDEAFMTIHPLNAR
ncbi:Pentatricopeptide repeat-containing protein [Quillaja saponaria]|uniref:Pentatricopeptide repeat-containing protein n=1 Tax=Quillaja saponaria TaxID=32244 RepID=A0AAD7PI92_QUISA|nr:Pentatricopeptide repeat-containing protein [Quillaja saponaria]